MAMLNDQMVHPYVLNTVPPPKKKKQVFFTGKLSCWSSKLPTKGIWSAATVTTLQTVTCWDARFLCPTAPLPEDPMAAPTPQIRAVFQFQFADKLGRTVVFCCTYCKRVHSHGTSPGEPYPHPRAPSIAALSSGPPFLSSIAPRAQYQQPLNPPHLGVTSVKIAKT